MSTEIWAVQSGNHSFWKNLQPIPAESAHRWRALGQQSLATGIADAGIAVRWESERRPAGMRWRPLLEGQLQKVVAACDYLEQHIADDDHIDIGAIALATALSWIEFRDVYAFQPGRPRLAAWYRRFCARPSMQTTQLHGDTIDQASPQQHATGAAHAVALG